MFHFKLKNNMKSFPPKKHASNYKTITWLGIIFLSNYLFLFSGDDEYISNYIRSII